MKLRSRLIRRLDCFGSVKATICININLCYITYDVTITLIRLLLTEEAQRQFIQDGKVSLILDRMTAYLDCPVIQEHGALVIGSLAVHSKSTPTTHP